MGAGLGWGVLAADDRVLRLHEQQHEGWLTACCGRKRKTISIALGLVLCAFWRRPSLYSFSSHVLPAVCCCCTLFVQALLYLVPCTLGIVLLLALSRGELHLLLDAVLDPLEDALEVDATDGGLDGTGSDAAAANSAGQRVALLAGEQGMRRSSSNGSGGGQQHQTLRA